MSAGSRSVIGSAIRRSDAERLGVLDVARGFEQKPDGSFEVQYNADEPRDITGKTPVVPEQDSEQVKESLFDAVKPSGLVIEIRPVVSPKGAFEAEHHPPKNGRPRELHLLHGVDALREHVIRHPKHAVRFFMHDGSEFHPTKGKN